MTLKYHGEHPNIERRLCCDQDGCDGNLNSSDLNALMRVAVSAGWGVTLGGDAVQHYCGDCMLRMYDHGEPIAPLMEHLRYDDSALPGSVDPTGLLNDIVEPADPVPPDLDGSPKPGAKRSQRKAAYAAADERKREQMSKLGSKFNEAEQAFSLAIDLEDE